MNMSEPGVLPTTIPEYLEQLRKALAGADPAMIQDALYDAEEYLRSELAEQPDKSEAEVIAEVAGSYGAPAEVAEIYRETEATVNRALRSPPPPQRRSWWGRFFAVAIDPRSYGALFYMLLSLATGIFYFTWVVTGISLSLGLLILIIGVPLLLLFLGSVRALSLVEGRIIEVLLGERMPRRPLYIHGDQRWLERVKHMFVDARTWTTMLYMLLMLPLGCFYFTVFFTLLSAALSFVASPFAYWISSDAGIHINNRDLYLEQPWLLPIVFVVGVLLFFVALHLARAFGKLHGLFAKHLLVRARGD